MKKEIRLLVEGFFDDELFNVNDDINQDITDIGNQYYDYHIGDIYYKDNEPHMLYVVEIKQSLMIINIDFAYLKQIKKIIGLLLIMMNIIENIMHLHQKH